MILIIITLQIASIIASIYIAFYMFNLNRISLTLFGILIGILNGILLFKMSGL